MISKRTHGVTYRLDQIRGTLSNTRCVNVENQFMHRIYVRRVDSIKSIDLIDIDLVD